MVDLSPAFQELSVHYRMHEVAVLQKAAGRARRSKRPGAAVYRRRKALGYVLNGRGDRASPGSGPLTVTGRVKTALLTPQTLEITPHDMYIGVRVRDSSGMFTGGIGYLVPLHHRFRLARRLSRQETNEWSNVVLRHITAAIEGA